MGFRTPTENDEQAVLEQFVPSANQFSRRLLHLDARLNVLVSDLRTSFGMGMGQSRDGMGGLCMTCFFHRYRHADIKESASVP